MHATVRLQGICMVPDASAQPAQDRELVEAISDEEGRFAFEGVPAIAVNLTATQDGYQETWPFRRTADEPIGTYCGWRPRPPSQEWCAVRMANLWHMHGSRCGVITLGLAGGGVPQTQL